VALHPEPDQRTAGGESPLARNRELRDRLVAILDEHLSRYYTVNSLPPRVRAKFESAASAAAEAVTEACARYAETYVKRHGDPPRDLALRIAATFSHDPVGALAACVGATAGRIAAEIRGEGPLGEAEPLRIFDGRDWAYYPIPDRVRIGARWYVPAPEITATPAEVGV
jgi:hypothetical protein